MKLTRFKKALVFLLTVCMVLSTFVVVSAEDTLSLKSESLLTIQSNGINKTINCLAEKITVSKFLSNFKNSDSIIISKNGEPLTENAQVGTGVSVAFGDDVAYVVLKGDVDGSGGIDSTDYLRLKIFFLKQYPLEGVYFSAADTTDDGEITATDYLRIKLHFLGVYNLFPDAPEEETSTNVSQNTSQNTSTDDNVSADDNVSTDDNVSADYNTPSQDEPFIPHKINSTDLMDSITPNTVATTDLTKGNKAYVDFVAKLFKESLASDGSNTLISPLSVIYAMGMATNGADGDTQAQLENVFGTSIEELNNYLYSYKQKLIKRQNAKLSIANSIWYDKNRVAVNPDFLQKNADYYGAAAYLADFSKLETVQDINNWCANNTEGMIEKVIEKINSDTVMYLINALAFEAQWEAPYDRYSVHKDDFTLETGEKVSADFMYASDGNYIEDENTTGFIKHYNGGYAFVALLPSEGTNINDYVSTLTGEKISNLLDSRKNFYLYGLSTSLPKFETEYNVSMVDTFKALGATAPFDKSNADFSKMINPEAPVEENLFIGDIIHKTFISVGELGTKAGAITVVEIPTEGMPSDYKTVKLNRPFVYMLVDTKTYTPFFIGTMMNPA